MGFSKWVQSQSNDRVWALDGYGKLYLYSQGQAHRSQGDRLWIFWQNLFHYLWRCPWCASLSPYLTSHCTRASSTTVLYSRFFLMYFHTQQPSVHIFTSQSCLSSACVNPNSGNTLIDFSSLLQLLWSKSQTNRAIPQSSQRCVSCCWNWGCWCGCATQMWWRFGALQLSFPAQRKLFLNPTSAWCLNCVRKSLFTMRSLIRRRNSSPLRSSKLRTSVRWGLCIYTRNA